MRNPVFYRRWRRRQRRCSLDRCTIDGGKLLDALRAKELQRVRSDLDVDAELMVSQYPIAVFENGLWVQRARVPKNLIKYLHIVGGRKLPENGREEFGFYGDVTV